MQTASIFDEQRAHVYYVYPIASGFSIGHRKSNEGIRVVFHTKCLIETNVLDHIFNSQECTVDFFVYSHVKFFITALLNS